MTAEQQEPMSHGCTRCYGVMLADTEDWEQPLCFECFVDVGEDPQWYEVEP